MGWVDWNVVEFDDFCFLCLWFCVMLFVLCDEMVVYVNVVFVEVYLILWFV